MSAGKTLQSISLLATLTLEQRCANPHLVVVPLSVLGNWMREIVFWCPKLKALKLHGNKEERAEQVATMREGKFNICVTTFETVGQEISALKKIAFEMLVIDEVSDGRQAGSTHTAHPPCLTHTTLLLSSPLLSLSTGPPPQE
jgi:SNF2 family DNA or RNA helicase